VRTTYDSDIPVYRRYPLVRILLQQLACDELLQCQDHAIFASDANGGATVLYRFHSVFDLEVAAIGREDGVGEIVAGAYGSLEGVLAVCWSGVHLDYRLTMALFGEPES